MADRTIGKLAKEAGVHVETIRYYERKGYLEQPKALGGYRKYSLQRDRACRHRRLAPAGSA